MQAKADGALEGCLARCEVLSIQPPLSFDGGVSDVLAQAAPGAPLLLSWAGHDAIALAGAGVPAGMLFVASGNDGVSHAPDEHSDPEAIAAAGAALRAALLALADGAAPLAVHAPRHAADVGEGP
jgi:N-carbamoyl-L-amino-acid hydrolase